MAAKHVGRATRNWKKVRGIFRTRCEAERSPCWLCGQEIDYSITDWTVDDVWEPDHFFPRSTHPDKAEDPTNLRPSHRGCNRLRGNGDGNILPLGTLSRDWFGQ